MVFTVWGSRTQCKRSIARIQVSICLSFHVFRSRSIFRLFSVAIPFLVRCPIPFLFLRYDTQTAISSLSKLIFYVFQPCLLFVNVASTLGTPGESFSKLLVLPVFAIFQIFFGSIVGRVSDTLFREYLFLWEEQVPFFLEKGGYLWSKSPPPWARPDRVCLTCSGATRFCDVPGILRIHSGKGE